MRKSLKFVPEAECKQVSISSREDLFNLIGEQISVVPIIWDSSNEILYVELSGFNFQIPKNEISIYHLASYCQSRTPKEVLSIFSKKQLSVKVMLSNEGEIYLSRRENMKDALDYFNSICGEIIPAKFISSLKYLSIFELGAGIVGAVPIQELSNSFVDKCEDYFPNYTESKYFDLKILEKGEDNKFLLSYKKSLIAPIYFPGDVVLGRVASYIPDKTGVFVELHPLVSGILNTDNVTVFNSQEQANRYHKSPSVVFDKYYNFIIKSVTKNGYKLLLLR
jgi:ribosomal protein S1